MQQEEVSCIRKRERERVENLTQDIRGSPMLATSTGKEPLSGVFLLVGMVTISLEASSMLHPILHSMSSHTSHFM